MTIKFTTEEITNVIASIEVDKEGWLLLKLNNIPVFFINPQNGIAGEWALVEEQSKALRRIGIETIPISVNQSNFKININWDEAAE